MASNNSSTALLQVPANRRIAGSRPHARCCLKSKPALLILFWNIGALILYSIAIDASSIFEVARSTLAPILLDIIFSFSIFLSPLAGFLADVKFGRYKTISCSSFVIIFELLCLPVMMIACTVTNHRFHLLPKVAVAFICLFFLIYLVVGIVSIITFMANGIHLGLDQLHDASSSDLVLFIQWFVCMQYASILAVRIIVNMVGYRDEYLEMRVAGISISAVVVVGVLAILIISLWVIKRNKQWFLIETAKDNPYKLAYRVLRFAARHKVPVNRSAFTYTGDEFPSRIDLGKRKYGGPFSTEQVEDVKTLLGILRVLFSLAPVFMVQMVSQAMLPAFAEHGYEFRGYDRRDKRETEDYPEGLAKHFLISGGILSPLLVVFFSLTNIYVVRKCGISFRHCGILRKLGLGAFLVVISLLATLLMDIAVHVSSPEHAQLCMFTKYTIKSADQLMPVANITYPLLFQNSYFYVGQHVLSALFNLLIDVAVLEFICSQSPRSMRGLLVGVMIALRSLFQAVAISSIIPFGAYWPKLWGAESVSCGSAFYLLYVVIGVLALLLYMCVAKRYKYRLRDDLSNEYIYAEAYYSK